MGDTHGEVLQPALTNYMDPDSLVATRKRRANAGSRLKQLIAIEEQNTEQRHVVYTEEDDDVQLLFQEDENDVEFEDPEEASDSGAESETAQDEPNEAGEADEADEADEAAVNSDDVLSDSDLSASDNDDTEGERQLEKEQREARKRRKKLAIPEIKRPKRPVAKPKPRPMVKHSELLLQSERRASSRKSALKNKEELLQKLKEDESRRAALDPVVRVREREPTQEERLAQAVETERENILSLHSFLEQEVVKKERQKYLLQLRRQKLTSVIRLVSAETYVTPFEEIEDARHVQDMFERKRRGRRRKNFYEETDPTRPGAIDTELPYYKKEMEERRRREEIERRLAEERAEKRRILEEERERKRELLERERLARKAEKEARFKEFENVDITAHDVPVPNPLDATDATDATARATEDATEDATETAETQTAETTEPRLEKDPVIKDEALTEVAQEPDTAEAPPEEVPGEPVMDETEEKTEKKVTFAEAEKEEPEEEVESRSATPVYRRGTNGVMFEGPVQRVCRNLVFLVDFEEQERWGLTEMRVKQVLFGDEAHLGPNKRLREVETIFKSSTRLDNPYAPPKEEKEDELLRPVTEVDEEDPMFEVLRRLPRLGTKDIMEEEIEDDRHEETMEVQIRTEAPSGLYLPNGNKKTCLISGKEVRYFDPATGVPYENKEVYQVIRAIEQGAYAWHSMGKDQNTYGAVEIYLNNRENPRHAAGVPEGFDGF